MVSKSGYSILVHKRLPQIVGRSLTTTDQTKKQYQNCSGSCELCVFSQMWLKNIKLQPIEKLATVHYREKLWSPISKTRIKDTIQGPLTGNKVCLVFCI